MKTKTASPASGRLRVASPDRSAFAATALALAFVGLAAGSLIYARAFSDAILLPKFYYASVSLAVLTIIVCFYTAFFRTAIVLHMTKADIFLVGFCLLTLVSSLLSAPVFVPELVSLGVVFMGYWLSKAYFQEYRTDRSVWVLFHGLALIALAQQGVFGLQWAGLLPNALPQFQAAGAFGNPNAYSAYQLSLVPLSLSIVLFKKNLPRGWQVLHAGVAAIGTLTIVAAQSRAALLGLMVAAGILLALRYRGPLRYFLRASRSKKGVLLAGALLLTVATLVGLFYLKYDSAIARRYIWQVSLQAAGQHPWFGTGLGSFEPVYNIQQAAYFAEHTNPEFARLAGVVDSPYNEYLNMLVENGLFALVLFLLFVAVVVKTAWHAIKHPFADPLTVGAGATFVGLLVTSCFNFTLYVLPVYGQFVLLAALITAGATPLVRLSLPRWALLAGALGLAVGARPLVAMGQADYRYREMVGLAKFVSPERALAELATVYPTVQHNDKFTLLYAHLLYREKQYERARQVLEAGVRRSADLSMRMQLGKVYGKLDQYEAAERCYRQASLIQPGKLQPKYILMLLYQHRQQPEKARQMAQAILNITEKTASPQGKAYQQEAQTYLIMNPLPSQP